MRPRASPPAVSAPYPQLCRLLKEVETITTIGSLLNWDQETYMPHGAAEHRSDQASFISALAHQRATTGQIGELIAACESDRTITADPASPEARSVREMRRDYDHRTKLPTELVAELAKVGSQAQEVWKTAREKNNFAMFEPWLERIMTPTRR